MNHTLQLRSLPVAVLVAAGLLGGCQSAKINEQTVAEANSSLPQALPAGALPARPVSGPTDYLVGPHDVLDIEVFGAKELTRSVRISEGGDFSLPLVGRVPAAGRTVGQLEQEIAARLEEKYLEDPQVTVFVKEYMSQRVTVEGAVEKPGIITLTGRTSLLQVIALSEGLDDLANPEGIVIYRNVDGRRYAAAFDIREIRAGRMVDPEVVGDDIVVVDYSGARAGLKDFLYTVPALALFMVL